VKQCPDYLVPSNVTSTEARQCIVPVDHKVELMDPVLIHFSVTDLLIESKIMDMVFAATRIINSETPLLPSPLYTSPHSPLYSQINNRQGAKQVVRPL
ncbi:hypothetical protein Bpfe_006890, partial [Biomphalaria pfeifferi]